MDLYFHGCFDCHRCEVWEDGKPKANGHCASRAAVFVGAFIERCLNHGKRAFHHNVESQV